MFTGALLLGGFVLLLYIARTLRRIRVAAETLVGALLLVGMAEEIETQPVEVAPDDDPFVPTA